MAQARVRRGGDMVGALATIGAVAAGAALLEVALLPGIVIGAAACFAAGPLARWGRKSPNRAKLASAPAPGTPLLPRLAIGRSLGKTVTFRIIVTSLDFSWNYVIIGELAAAAGLSAFSLAAGPFFYFLYESGWNYFKQSETAPDETPLSLHQTVLKTALFRVFATTNEFAANYFVVRDLPTAALLTAPGFVIGPFVYLGHELLWDRFSPVDRTGKIEILPPLKVTRPAAI